MNNMIQVKHASIDFCLPLAPPPHTPALLDASSLRQSQNTKDFFVAELLTKGDKIKINVIN